LEKKMSVKNRIGQLKNFLNEVWFEANPKNGNVVWPSKKEIWTTTGVVIIFVLIASLYIGLLDGIFSFLLKLIFG
jgi:preprotein translocase SecE subunit